MLRQAPISPSRCCGPGEERLRLAVGLHRLDRIAETPEEPALIDQELRFFARLHGLAGRELRVEVERALVGAEPLMQQRPGSRSSSSAGARASASDVRVSTSASASW